MLSTILRFRIFWLLLSVSAFFIAYRLLVQSDIKTETAETKLIFEEKIAEAEKQFANDVSAHDLGIRLTQNQLSYDQLQQSASFPFICLIYLDDSLIFWNNNSCIPTEYAAMFSVGTSFQRFRNGYYLLNKENITNEQTNKCVSILRLLPVKFDFNSTNKYLQSSFQPLFNFPSYVIIDEQKESSGLPVVSSTGTTLFKFFIDESARENQPNKNQLYFFLLGLCFLFLFLNGIINALSVKWKSVIAFCILVLVNTGDYFLRTKSFWMPHGIKNLVLFSPDIYASGFALSLGQLLMSATIVLWSSLVFYRHISFGHLLVRNKKVHVIASSFTFLLICILSIQIFSLFKSLVRDSNVAFEFYNPFDPDQASMFAVLSISLYLIAFYLFIDKMLHEIRFGKQFVLDIILCVTSFCFVYIISTNFHLEIRNQFVAAWVFVLLFLFWITRSKYLKPVNFIRVFSFLIFLSGTAAVLLNYYNTAKEKNYRMTYANKLVNKRDDLTEFLLFDLETKITESKLVQDYFSFRHITQANFDERVYQQFFRNQFNRYDIKFFSFNPDGSVLRSKGKLRFDNILRPSSNDTIIEVKKERLYAVLSSSGDLTYLVNYPVRKKSKLIGTLAVEMTAKVYRAINVYPELLLEEKNKLASNLNQYSYAIYNNDQLLFQNGEYPYAYHLYKPAEQNQSYFDAGGYNHLIQKTKPGTTIILSKKDSWFRDLSTNFSYVFVVCLLFIIFIFLYYVIKPFHGFKRWMQIIKTASFQNTIQAGFLIVIFLAVAGIGIFSGRIFISQYNKESKEKVVEKLNNALQSVNYLINEAGEVDSLNVKMQEHFFSVIKEDINDISEIQAIDMNVFDLQGNLIVSSQPAIFDKGYTSRKINPFALFELTSGNKPQLVQQEKIGELNYLSGYVTVRNKNGTPISFINIPFFNTRKNLNLQLGYFFATLINILVITLIVAGLFAPIISKQIIRKLSVIADRFKEVNLGRKNEKIEWHANDELGILVDEFNKMIAKLEESADKLAKSERESAWREMAKQVAHEIKNPLTPMKLSIQHLQRAYSENSPRAKELAEKVSQTLIEQIDNLSRIATEFSNFAKMPHAQKELLNLHAVLQNSVELYRKNEETEIEFLPLAENAEVMADRNQLLSVFNNLILNAIQAIPEETTGKIVVRTTCDEKFITAEIIDNGKGISEENASRVFTPNFTTKNSGTGLGLAISKNIIDSFEGKIYFESKVNEGTTFFVQLPIV